MPTFKDVDAETVSGLASDLNRVGFACIHDYLTVEQLGTARTEIDNEAGTRGRTSFAIRGTPNIPGTLFEHLALSDEFQQLITRVYTSGTGHAPLPSEKIHTVIRCLQGSDSTTESNRFHYDATTLTVLLPVSIPNRRAAGRGRFVLFPNVRKLRRSAMFNAAEKVLIQNRISQWLVAQAISGGLLHPTRIELIPGSLYFFWGYRSLHANEPCDPQALRSTVLFHYGNPHRHSQIARLVLPKGR